MKKERDVSVSEVLDFIFGQSVGQKKEASDYGDQVHKGRELYLKGKMREGRRDGDTK